MKTMRISVCVYVQTAVASDKTTTWDRMPRIFYSIYLDTNNNAKFSLSGDEKKNQIQGSEGRN